MSFSVYIKPHSNNNDQSSTSSSFSEDHNHRLSQACQVPSIMPKKIQTYISKLRKNPNPQINLSSSKNWVLNACKHPKTLSIDIDHHRKESQPHDSHHLHNNNNNDAASLSDVDRFLFENFKSLYLKDDQEDEDKDKDKEVDESHPPPKKLEPIIFDSSPRLDLTLPQDLRGSNRFFVTPGTSSSLVEDAARLSVATTTCDDDKDEELANGFSSSSTTSDYPNNNVSYVENEGSENLPRDDFIAVLMYSPRPYDEFKRSMQDMIEARVKNEESVDWDFMEELLFYYLNLNHKKSHKFILSAFVDVIGGLRRRSETVPPPPPATLPRSVRTVRVGRRRW